MLGNGGNGEINITKLFSCKILTETKVTQISSVTLKSPKSDRKAKSVGSVSNILFWIDCMEGNSDGVLPYFQNSYEIRRKYKLSAPSLVFFQ